MLNSLDIAVLCDKVWTDADGNRRTADRSRHGIHPVLGDGTTVGTFPTWDAQNGRFTFDGGDWMNLGSTDPSNVLDDMGSIQDETYIFYFDPFVVGAGGNSYYINNDDNFATPRFFLRHNQGVGSNQWDCRFISAAGTQQLLTAVDSILPYEGKRIVWTLVRSTNLQELFIDAVPFATDADVSRDGRDPGVDINIGRATQGAFPFPAGTGLRFFGYAQQAFTQVQLAAIQKFLRGVL